ncbi:MAG: hypothetical protein WAO83_21765 [Fuerstiella sp.]
MTETDSELNPTDGPLLSARQLIGIAGIVLAVVGAFSPVLDFRGAPQSFVTVGNMVAAIVLASGAASAWAINIRKPLRQLASGVLTLLIVSADFVSLWFHEVRQPAVKGWFGTYQTDFHTSGWILLLLGGVLQVASGWNVRRQLKSTLQSLQQPWMITWISHSYGLIAWLFLWMVLFAIGHDAPHVRDMFRQYSNELLIFKCLLLTTSIAFILISFSNQRLLNATRRPWPRTVHFFLWGPMVLVFLFEVATASSLGPSDWMVIAGPVIALLSVLSISFSRHRLTGVVKRPLPRPVIRITWMIVAMFAVLLSVLTEFGEFGVVASPGIAFLALAQAVCSTNPRIRQGVVACNAVILVAVVMLLISEIPHELPKIAGLAEHEGKVVLTLIGLWLVFVSVVLRTYEPTLMSPSPDTVAGS